MKTQKKIPNILTKMKTKKKSDEEDDEEEEDDDDDDCSHHKHHKKHHKKCHKKHPKAKLSGIQAQLMNCSGVLITDGSNVRFDTLITNQSKCY